MATYDESTADEKTSRRYTAALVAIQFGMYDAFIDWGLTYTTCYAIVGGITWYNADQNLVSVIWGFSLMASALIVAVTSLKIPQWLGYYRKSHLKTIRDTSNFAIKAVEDFTNQDSTLAAFRFQARLGVGKHFTQFVWFLLPFYVALKFWFFLLSVALGLVGGQIFLYIVFKCRKRFVNNRGKVAMGASFFVALVSAVCFMFGVWVIDEAWGIPIGKTHVILPVAFFVWLVVCGLFHGFKFLEHRKHSSGDMDEGEQILFEQTVRDEQPQDANDAEEQPQDDADEVAETAVAVPNESINSTDRRQVMDKESGKATHGYFYQTGKYALCDKLVRSLIVSFILLTRLYIFYVPRYVAYFDRVKKPTVATSFGDQDNNDNDANAPKPREVYRAIAETEDFDTGVKWYNRVWRFLPFMSYYGLFLIGCRDLLCCSKKNKDENPSGFQTMSTCQKGWFVVAKIIKVAVNAGAIFLAVFAMGAAIQATVSKAKTPFVHSRYRTLNTGEVCAYDVKCGNIDTFENKAAADAANYTIVHCGRCSGCSSWQDLSVQWNTRKDAAKLSQGCGLQNMFNRDNMAKCMRDRMGWTTDCSYAWVASVECAKQVSLIQ